MKFFPSLDDKRKNAEQKAAEAAKAELDLQQAESIVAQHTGRLNNLDERIVQSTALQTKIDEACKYTIADFTRDFLNNPTAVNEFAARLYSMKNLILDAPEIKKEIEKNIVQPHRKSLADFESQHKAILKTLPKPERKPEPPFKPQKLPADFYTAGGSAKLTQNAFVK